MSVSLIDGHIDDDVLTDEQIIKASEYCIIQGITSECERCEVKKGCRSELIANALYLIKRQKAEIERLQNIIKVADKTIELQSAEISAKRNLLEEAESELVRLNVVIDRQKDDIELLGIEHKAIRAEAVKEFAERLKNAVNPISIGENYKIAVINWNGIDNLVKEMVGAESG